MTRMNTAFSDYFRCPEDVVELSTAAGVSQNEGFFTFDGDTCFGRLSGGSPAGAVTEAPDVTDAVTERDGRLQLPFDLSEVATNLRCERYFKDGTSLTENALARSAYYAIRPFLPVTLRKHLQKVCLRGWENIPFPRWPVDVSVDSLMRSVFVQILKRRSDSAVPFIWFWPDGAPSCSMVTHDVEHEPGREFCSALMDMDDEFGIKSAFQVVPEGRYDRPIELADTIRSRGFEVNVHDLNHDGNLFRDKREFLNRVGRINQYARQFQSRGFRSGAMYREQDWFDALELSFDMSVPNVAHLEPQRGGCCTVMPYFVGRLLELPLTTVQDYSLFHILGDYSTALWTEQMRQIKQANGLISFVTHPDYLTAEPARAVYRDLLAKLSREREEGNLWMALPSEVDRWWRERHEMRLVPTGDSWRIEGRGCARARVAYAVLQDGRCVYRLDPHPMSQAVPSRAGSARS